MSQAPLPKGANGHLHWMDHDIQNASLVAKILQEVCNNVKGPSTATKPMFYDYKTWLHSIVKSKNMDECKNHYRWLQHDWVESLPTSRFGLQSYFARV